VIALALAASIVTATAAPGHAQCQAQVVMSPRRPQIGHRVSARVPNLLRHTKLELELEAKGRSVRIALAMPSSDVMSGTVTARAARSLGAANARKFRSLRLKAELRVVSAKSLCAAQPQHASPEPSATAPSAADHAGGTGSTTPTVTAVTAGVPAGTLNTSPGATASTLSPVSTSVNALEWAPPALSQPQTITVASGEDPDHLALSTSKDYILKLPADGLHGTLEIDGGHNVVLIGGSITVPSTANQTDNGADNTDTAIYITHSTGTVHIEGVAITGDPDTQFDGIDINAPQAIVQLENIRVTNVWGSDTTEHADVVQTWGGVQDLRIDNLTASGDYQGLTLNPNLGAVGSVELSNVDLTYVAPPQPLASMTVGGGYMLWLTNSTNSCAAPGNTTFNNVYIDDAYGRVPVSNTAWPTHATSSLACAGQVSGDEETWPGLPTAGHVTLGAPPNGSYVTATEAGLDYTSPGYGG
jgi:hypothetical protein